jgi:hypothetical protein
MVDVKKKKYISKRYLLLSEIIPTTSLKLNAICRNYSGELLRDDSKLMIMSRNYFSRRWNSSGGIMRSIESFRSQKCVSRSSRTWNKIIFAVDSLTNRTHHYGDAVAMSRIFWSPSVSWRISIREFDCTISSNSESSWITPIPYAEEAIILYVVFNFVR